MTSGDEGKLFAGLPEHPAPERTYQDKPRLRMAERRQVELRAICLDDLVPTGHRVRMAVGRPRRAPFRGGLPAKARAREGDSGANAEKRCDRQRSRERVLHATQDAQSRDASFLRGP